MKKFLWFHIFIEGLAGLVLFFYPHLLYFKGTEQIEAFPIIKLYGLLAVTFAVAYAMINKVIEEKSKLFIQLYLVAMGFQLFVAFQCYGLVKTGYLSHNGAFFTHLIGFIILTIGYFLHRFDKT